MRSHVDITYLHDHPISVSEEVWAYVTNLAQPCFTEVPVSSQERELSCISVVCVSIVPVASVVIPGLASNEKAPFFIRPQC